MLDHFRLPKNLATDRMPKNVLVQPFAEIPALRQNEEATVVNQPGTEIAAFKRNDPAPPAQAHKVVGRPRPPRARGRGVIGKFLSPVVAVPIFHAGEARPDGVDRMVGVLAEMAELASQKRGPPGRIDYPAATDFALFVADLYA